MAKALPRVTIVEPWHGESHASFVDGLASHSRCPSRKVTMPATKWKWRMRTGSWHLAPLLEKALPDTDILLFSDYVNLPALLGFVPALHEIPKLVYFHENQLTYPLRRGTSRDFEFCAINVLSCLAADGCVFSSRQQMEAFLDGVIPFLAHDEDMDPVEIITLIEDKSVAIPVGVDSEPFEEARRRRATSRDAPLHIVWPHRFEHDKNPEDFFEVLFDLHKEGLPFRISAVGRSYRDVPPIFEEAKSRLDDRIVAWGFKRGDEYAAALAKADVVVSTAWQETLGLAVIEAVIAGCDPLLPNRLSYPEVLGENLREHHLYQNKGELRRKLRWMMRHPDRVRETSDHHEEMTRFFWPNVTERFDRLFREVSAKHTGDSSRSQ